MTNKYQPTLQTNVHIHVITETIHNNYPDIDYFLLMNFEWFKDFSITITTNDTDKFDRMHFMNK